MTESPVDLPEFLFCIDEEGNITWLPAVNQEEVFQLEPFLPSKVRYHPCLEGYVEVVTKHAIHGQEAWNVRRYQEEVDVDYDFQLVEWYLDTGYSDR